MYHLKEEMRLTFRELINKCSLLFIIAFFLTPVSWANGEGVYKEETTCSKDTLEYLWTKTSAINSVEVFDSHTRTKYGEAYYPNQQVAIHGFYFYASLDMNKDTTRPLKGKVYTLNDNGLPETALDSIEIDIDTVEAGRKYADFSDSVVVSDSFAITLGAMSSKSIWIYTNDQGDGNKENRGLTYVPSFSSWYTLGGNQVDILIFPVVSYDVNTDFQPSDRNICNSDTVSFTNKSSKILDQRDFNQYNPFPMQCPKNLTTTLKNGGSLLNDTVYSYKISALDEQGRETIACTHQKDTTTASQRTIELNWEAVFGADSYRVYRELKGDTLTSLITTSTSFTDNGSASFNPTSPNDTPLYTEAMADYTPRYPISEDTLRGDVINSKVPVDSLSWNFVPQKNNYGDTYTWNIDNQFYTHNKDTSKMFPEIGKFTVSLLDSLKGWHMLCTGRQDTTITSNPLADVTQDTSICERDSAQLLAEGGLTYQWSPATGLSDTNVADPKAGPTDTTTYTVTITDINGCSIDTSVTVQVQGIPRADFGFTRDSLTVHFHDSSYAVDDHFWRFDDGRISTASDPTHTYQGEGTYNVQLSVESRCGADTSIKKVKVPPESNIIVPSQSPISINTYPQPATQYIKLVAQKQSLQKLDIRVYNLQGKAVYTSYYKNVPHGDPIRIPVDELSPGQYMLLIQSEEGRHSRSINIQRP